IELISRVRNIRSEMNVKAGDRVLLLVGVAGARLRQAFEDNSDQIARLTRASEVSISEKLTPPKASARAVLAGGGEVAIPLEGLIEFAQERAELIREKEKQEKEGSKLETQLGNA